MRRLPLVVSVVVLVAGACTSGDNDEAQQDGTERRPSAGALGSPGSDQLEDERQAIVAAREAAHEASIAALAPPEANPTLAALPETHTGPALEAAVTLAEVDQNNGVVWTYPADSRQRIDVQSVTFQTGREIEDGAWIETCIVDDAERVGTNGQPRPLGDPPGVVTVQFTELMRHEAGVWKLAERWRNTQVDGITGCATDTDPQEPAGDLDTDAVSEARQAAEQAWIDYLADPNAAPPTDHYTGYAARFFGGVESIPWLVDHCPSTDQRPNVTVDLAVGGTETVDKQECVRRWEIGNSSATFNLRSIGSTFTGTSTVTIQAVSFPQGAEDPEVAYLLTCRNHRLARNDPQPFAYPDATIHSIDTMHWEDGTWKLAARGAFTIQPADTACPPSAYPMTAAQDPVVVRSTAMTRSCLLPLP